jgi:hypothetical protein
VSFTTNSNTELWKAEAKFMGGFSDGAIPSRYSKRYIVVTEKNIAFYVLI